ncbi:MAG: MBL fold metallo-hydrolase [Erysipelotrichaceae bacterium]|nr:MBL fold metallo-hydrolase [Erysipelotrichaceae bacterium]
MLITRNRTKNGTEDHRLSNQIRDSLYSTSVLIDTGSSYQYYSLKKKLFCEGIYRIDYLIITHDDEDHNGNIENLKKDFKIMNIVETGVDIDCRRIFLKYYDLCGSDNDNDSSLVYAAWIGSVSFLFTGIFLQTWRKNFCTVTAR